MLARSHGLLFVLSSLASILLAVFVASCDERVPPALGGPAPAPLAPDWGLDARPLSPGCRAEAKPPAVTASNARVSFVPLTQAPLANLVEIVEQSGRIYVADRSGLIRYLASDGMTAPVVLDLHDKVSFGYDSGLVSFAFHPNFAQNGYVYVAYMVPYPTQPPPPDVVFLSVLGRFQSKDGGLTIDPTTEKRLLVRDQPTPNHNGNKVLFGNDGYLYFAVGEGTKSVRAQDTSSLFGKILRIDVDGGDPYAIPPSNPFAQGGGAPEVYAYGFRNPWRFSIDKPTGDMWVGDVGQDAFEEIDRVVKGGNYGWAIREGRSCYLAATCSTTGLIEPLVVHPHTEASAIIGGFVYRGSAIPSLVGKYVYGDFTFHSFWAVDPNNPVPVRIDEGLIPRYPNSIGIDSKNELMFVTVDGAFRIAPPEVPAPETAAKLGDTGCVDPTNPAKPALGLFPYDVNVPQWNDGAVATRFLSIPDGAQLAVGPGGRLDLPQGSVAMRTLRREDKLVETQLLLKRPDGSTSLYAYAWSSDQKNAVLATAPVTVTLPSGKTHEIRPQDCAGCHDAHRTGVATTLGLEASQLDRSDVDYGSGRLGNPLVTLSHNAMLSMVVAPESYVALPSPTGYDTPERRARAYLHGNCAFCHDGSADFSGIDLRSFVPLRDTKLCGVPGASKTGGNLRLAPGNPDDSQLVTSVRATGAGRMPPLGSTLPDTASADLLSTWIRSLSACP